MVIGVQNHFLKYAQLRIFQGQEANVEFPVSATPTCLPFVNQDYLPVQEEGRGPDLQHSDSVI